MKEAEEAAVEVKEKVICFRIRHALQFLILGRQEEEEGCQEGQASCRGSCWCNWCWSWSWRGCSKAEKEEEEQGWRRIISMNTSPKWSFCFMNVTLTCWTILLLLTVGPFCFCYPPFSFEHKILSSNISENGVFISGSSIQNDFVVYDCRLKPLSDEK